MEHLLRYAVLALLEQPAADISQIVPLFVDKEFRRKVIATVTDAQVRAFWTMEYPKMNYATSIDGVSPIANKLGAFLADPRIRQALCNPEKPLRFRKIMDDGGALIVNLAKGKIGASSANVLGGLIASNIMHAAFSRHDVSEDQRRPFFLYVDEFHALTSTAFADLLPEARKYGLGLILAHQHIGQTERDIFDAIIGNVGSIMAFRVGVRDAALLTKQLDGLKPTDLQRLPNYHCAVQLMINGRKSSTFSARTIR
ncbi:MAG: type IV secretory system conjugative DNA transfer family protein [Parasphingorhabdus sp.]